MKFIIDPHFLSLKNEKSKDRIKVVYLFDAYSIELYLNILTAHLGQCP